MTEWWDLKASDEDIRRITLVIHDMFESKEKCFTVDENKIYLAKYIIAKLCEEDDKWLDFPDEDCVKENKIFSSIYSKIDYQLRNNRESINGKIVRRQQMLSG
jgi:hypothetical protein